MSTLRGAEAYLHAYAASIFGWKCVICSIEAPDQLGLNGQHTASETSVYTDGIDHSKWVTCAKCNSYFHLACVTVGTQQTENQINREVLFALSWGVERYTFNRYNFNRYKTFIFRKMVKTKHSDKQRPRRKHSPKSSHKGDDIGDYTQKDLDYARDLWEKTKDLPKGQGHLTLRQISEASGIKLGTLNKRTTGKLPWMRNIGGKRIP